jgi:hypothetical protein
MRVRAEKYISQVDQYFYHWPTNGVASEYYKA